MQTTIIRKSLLTAILKSTSISQIEVKEINFEPGQATGLHTHPCPVVGYIVQGSVLFQIEGKQSQILNAGDAFYEPAETKVLHFDNYSKNESLRFIAFYLLSSPNQELISLINT